MFIILAHHVSFAFSEDDLHFNTTFHVSQFFHTFHVLYYHLGMATQYRRIHGQQHCLVVGPDKSTHSLRAQRHLEISSTRVFPVQHPSRRTRLCSAYNSGEDATSAPVSSEVDERQSIGRLASPLPMQKRETSVTPARVYHSTGESCCDTHTHKRKSSRDRKGVRENTSQMKELEINNRRIQSSLKFRAEAVQTEHEVLSRLQEAEFHTGVLLEAQRNQILQEKI